MDRDMKQITSPNGHLVTQATLDEGTASTVIAKGITVSGSLHGEGDVLVEGTVIGGIDVGGSVGVTESGTVNGPINANEVDVSGCVEGDITARTYLRLKMTGSITGDVTVRSFIIEEGGYFSGQSHMTHAGEEPTILY